MKRSGAALSLLLTAALAASAMAPVRADPPVDAQAAWPAAVAAPARADFARLSGHVLPALGKAKRVAGTKASAAEASAAQPLTLTVVLRRTDPAGFQAYLSDVYDSASPNFRKFLSPQEIADRFGPSRDDYQAVLEYFAANGFALREGSDNRLTLTLAGSRAATEAALAVQIGDYQIGERSFFANDAEPALPATIASRVDAVVGLSNLAVPRPMLQLLPNNPWGQAAWYALCANYAVNGNNTTGAAEAFSLIFGIEVEILTLANILIDIAQASDLSSSGTAATYAKCVNEYNSKYGYSLLGGWDPPPPAWQGATGAGQTVGLLQFDTFQTSDVEDYASFMHLASGPASNVTQVHVNGGATPGADQDEVLLDIAVVLTAAPGAKIKVFDGPFTGTGTSFQTMFNAMINGGVTIISNSWSYCEDQTTLADVQSIDTILQSAAASGISVLTGAGDHGSDCLDGSPNTAHVPASSPHITAVGGTSLTLNPGFTYGSETWWDGSASTPPTGQGGFGVSTFFARPSYQDGLTPSTMRSIPDVSAAADPKHGMMICQASSGGCPTGNLYGGTSAAAPLWAAFAALLNQTQGTNLGFLNPLIYPFANTNAFHTPTSMGSDFAHVGLGSPNLARLHERLTSQTTGPADASVSSARAYAQTTFGFPPAGTPLPAYADGKNQTFIVVTLADANGNPVGGKAVSLSGNAGSNVVFTPPSGVTTDADTGVAIFWATDTTAELVTVTVKDTDDNVTLTDAPRIQYFTPPATAGGIGVVPSTVAADGSSAATITVTLQDAQGNGAQGKVVTLSQGAGRSVISGPTPALTDTNGQVTFAATDVFTEIVTYTATDVTDGNQAVPGSAQVSFTSGSGSGCPVGQEIAAAGWSVTSPVTGFALASNCVGVSGTAWDPDGNLWALNYPTGKLYKFSPAGGVASAGTLVGTLPNVTPPTGLPSCPHGLAFSKDGQHLYVARQFCGSGGDVVEVSMADASIVKNVTAANAIPCATGIATDPISGDLFVTSPCQAGDNLWRIANPDSASPVLSVYATPGRAIGLNFTPDGTIWTEAYPSGTAGHELVKISATNAATPGTVTVLSTSAPQFAGGVLPALNPASPGSPAFLIVSNGATSGSSGSVQKADLTQSPPVFTTIATGGTGEILVNAGPDGCAYVSNGDRIDRIAAADGSCNFATSSSTPALVLAPASVAPNPAQGTQTSFTATFVNVAAPANTVVSFEIGGANATVLTGHTNASGQAAVTYTGAVAGSDTVVARANLGSQPLKSNQATVTWVAGKHRSFVSLNSSPSGGTASTPTTLKASLADTSVNPVVAIAGVSLHFSLGAASCDGTTNASGAASCSLTSPAPGRYTLNVSFAGNGQYLPSAAAQTFDAIAGVGSLPGAPTIDAVTAGNGVVVVAFSPPADSGGSAISGFIVACTPVGGGVTVTAEGTSSPITVHGLLAGVAYTCTVSAVNGAGTGPESPPSNVFTAVAAAGIASIPTLDAWAMMLLITLLLLFGVERIAGPRRRQQRKAPGA